MPSFGFLEDRDAFFMLEALKEAEKAFYEDEVPVGAVIVFENKIISRGYNQVEKLKDSTAHAEIIAITQAENALGNKFLNNCTIYVTIEPCFMCLGAIVLARIKRVVFACREPKFGAVVSLLDIQALSFNHSLEVKEGVLEKESSYLMQSFFQKRR